MATKRYLLGQTALGTSLLFLLGLSNATAADLEAIPDMTAPVDGSLPAVSGINGKLVISGGGTQPGFDFGFSPFDDDFEGAFKAKGAVTVPLGHRFGLQADGVLGSVQSELYGHAAAHLFWRDPSQGLLGGYTSWTTWDSIDAFRAGVEGEAYLGQFTLTGVVGAEWGDVDNGLFSIADVGVYATDNMRFTVGHRYAEEVGHAFAAGVEYQFRSTASTGWSVFADGRIGEDDYQSIFAGLKIYFGDDKSLIRRHREDDPDFRDDENVTACTEGALMVDAIVTDSSIPQPNAVTVDGVLDSSFSPEVPCNFDFKLMYEPG